MPRDKRHKRCQRQGTADDASLNCRCDQCSNLTDGSACIKQPKSGSVMVEKAVVAASDNGRQIYEVEESKDFTVEESGREISMHDIARASSDNLQPFRSEIGNNEGPSGSTQSISANAQYAGSQYDNQMSLIDPKINQVGENINEPQLRDTKVLLNSNKEVVVGPLRVAIPNRVTSATNQDALTPSVFSDLYGQRLQSDPLRDNIDTDVILKKAEVYDRLCKYQRVARVEMAEQFSSGSDSEQEEDISIGTSEVEMNAIRQSDALDSVSRDLFQLAKRPGHIISF